MNKVILIGRTGTEVETFTFDNGNKKASVSLATSKSWRDQNGQKQERTEWHKLEVFGKLCDIFENYVKKGDLISIEGEINYNKSKDNTYFTSIKVFNLEMLGSKSKLEPLTEVKQEDDLPF